MKSTRNKSFRFFSQYKRFLQANISYIINKSIYFSQILKPSSFNQHVNVQYLICVYYNKCSTYTPICSPHFLSYINKDQHIGSTYSHWLLILWTPRVCQQPCDPFTQNTHTLLDHQTSCRLLAPCCLHRASPHLSSCLVGGLGGLGGLRIC